MQFHGSLIADYHVISSIYLYCFGRISFIPGKLISLIETRQIKAAIKQSLKHAIFSYVSLFFLRFRYAFLPTIDYVEFSFIFFL